MKLKRPILIFFSPFYAFAVWFRNKLFNLGLLKETEFNIPIIVVGNLNVGGTGKTPHTIWLSKLLAEKMNTAVLSRGYGRKTNGYILAKSNSQALEIGDEPLEILKSNNKITLAVCEKRVEGITNLLNQKGDLQTIILDDAFQHRYVKPGLNILLTAYDDLFSNDFILPAGNLRESKSGKKRAHIVIVTKCPLDLSINKQQEISKSLRLSKNQILGFSSFKYKDVLNKEGNPVEFPKKFILLTGIAQPKYLKDYLDAKDTNYQHLKFKDHHNFTDQDYKKLKEVCTQLETSYVLTTTKDAMRLDAENEHLKNLHLLTVPIAVEFIANQSKIEDKILSFVLSK